MVKSGTYAYCVVRRQGRPSITRLAPGVPGASPPRIVDTGGKRHWLVCADVPLAAYGERAIGQKLRDLEWVSRVALAHEAVVERFTRVRRAVVIPMKLFTIFASEDRAVAEMRRKRAEIENIAVRIRDCEEWAVRITRAAAPPALRAPTGRPATGAAFLAAKKRARDLQHEEAVRAAKAAEAAHRALEKIARAVARRPAPEGSASPPLLDAAYLVPVHRKARFRSTAARLARSCTATGVELLLTGPWPAYNFLQEGERNWS